MATRPGVDRPSWAWFVLLDGGLAALAVLAGSETAHAKVTKWSPAPFPSRSACQSLLANAVVLHVAEALAADRMARRRGLSPRGWRIQTLIVGFPSLRALRRVPRSGGVAAPGAPVTV
ncbi:MAG: TMEM254 family protein [Acidimicrobiales bacterium]